MFPKRQRISKGTFQDITSKGRRAATEHLTITKTPLETGVLSRFAVVVSKKVAPTAVSRNLIRRRVFGALKELCGDEKAVAYVVFAKKGTPTLKYTDIKKEIETLVRT